MLMQWKEKGINFKKQEELWLWPSAFNDCLRFLMNAECEMNAGFQEACELTSEHKHEVGLVLRRGRW